MKKCVQRFVVAVLAAAVMAGCASPPSVPTSPSSSSSSPPFGKAIVRSVHGEVTYATNGLFMPLKINRDLPAGTTIKSSPGSDAWLQVNGFTSTIKVTGNSEVELTKMDVHGTGRDADTETLLTVKYGTILYSVRKLSANSRYEVHTPKGVAAVRGTDFQVTVTFFTAGKGLEVLVTYTCVTGQLLVSADVDGHSVTKVLATGQSWVPGEGDVTVLPPLIIPGYGGPLSFQFQPPKPLPPPPVVLQQPFNGSGAPNPAVDVGQNPFQRVTPAPIPHPPPPPLPTPPPAPGSSGSGTASVIPASPPPTHH